MESERWKKASLAISSIIRGLELDQVEFQFDEDAWRAVDGLLGSSAFMATGIGSAAPGSEIRSELHPM